MNERGWMRHSVGLCKARVEQFNHTHPAPGGDTARYLKWLEWELAWREHVMAITVRGSTAGLSELGRIWLRYMRNHARAQMARYANEISEDQFRARVDMMRRARNDLIRRYTGKKVA